MNVQELSNSDNLNFQSFTKREQKIDFSAIVPSAPTVIAKNNNCSNAASQKIF